MLGWLSEGSWHIQMALSADFTAWIFMGYAPVIYAYVDRDDRGCMDR